MIIASSGSTISLSSRRPEIVGTHDVDDSFDEGGRGTGEAAVCSALVAG